MKNKDQDFPTLDYDFPTKSVDDISQRTLEMIERSLDEFERGNVSDPIDIEKELPELFEDTSADEV